MVMLWSPTFDAPMGVHTIFEECVRSLKWARAQRVKPPYQFDVRKQCAPCLTALKRASQLKHRGTAVVAGFIIVGLLLWRTCSSLFLSRLFTQVVQSQ